MMNIVDVCLGQIVLKLEFFYSLKQCQPSGCILSKCLCQIKSEHRWVEGSVTNEDIIGVSGIAFFVRYSTDVFEDLP